MTTEQNNKSTLEAIATMARIKKPRPYKGPRKMLATMSVSRPIKVKKVTKYLYCLFWSEIKGRNIKRRRPNPLYEAADA